MKRDRHAVLGYTLLAAVGLIWAALLMAKARLLPLPHPAVFAAILLLLILPSLTLGLWVDRWLQGAWPRRTRPLWGLYLAAMLAPLAAALLGGRWLWDALPVPVIGWVMLWYLAALGLVTLGTAWAVVYLLFKAFNNWFARRPNRADPDPPLTGDAHRRSLPTDPIRRRVARREVLGWAAAAAPLAAVGAAAGVGLGQAGRFRVRRVTMALERCPDRLKGLTITHLSDLHVGRLFRPEHLPAMVEAANRLDSDLVVVTGDVVDHDIAYLPHAAEAIAQLKNRYGRFLVVGNHDLIDSPHQFVTEMAAREPGLLCDRRVTLDVGGEKLRVVGLFWSQADRSEGRGPGHAERAAHAMAGADPRGFTIGLAHHPHAFDALAARGVDLTLAGHTHGGQFNLPLPGSPRTLSAGALMFRYIRGEYRHGHAALFVNAGVGNWFPLRVNAPAEIVQIQLV